MSTPSRRRFGLLSRPLLIAASRQALVTLRPDLQWKDPPIFAAEMGAVLSIVLTLAALAAGYGGAWVTCLVVLGVGLGFTVLGMNFASALAAAQTRIHSAWLHQKRQEIPAFRIRNYAEGKQIFRTLVVDSVGDGPVDSRNYEIDQTVSTGLQRGDLVLVEPGLLIPGDGDIAEGAALVDESAINGESTPVLREAGGDYAGVRGGTRVLSGCIVVRMAGTSGKPFSVDGAFFQDRKQAAQP